MPPKKGGAAKSKGKEEESGEDKVKAANHVRGINVRWSSNHYVNVYNSSSYSLWKTK